MHISSLLCLVVIFKSSMTCNQNIGILPFLSDILTDTIIWNRERETETERGRERDVDIKIQEKKELEKDIRGINKSVQYSPLTLES